MSRHRLLQWFLILCLLAVSAAAAFAANDPGHDTLYVLRIGSTNVTGNINISGNLNATLVRVNEKMFGDYLDIVANGTVLGAPSQPRIMGALNALYIDSTNGLYLNTKGGTNAIIQIGDTGTNGVTLNVSGLIRQQGKLVCLADGTNCLSGNNSGNVSSIIAGTGISVNQNTGAVTVSTNATTCGASQYSYWDGNSWECRADANSGGTGNITGSGTANTVPKFTGAGSIGNSIITDNGNVSIDTNTLFIDATNNRVGIGTTSPNNELEVIGNIRIEKGTNNGDLFFTDGTAYSTTRYGGKISALGSMKGRLVNDNPDFSQGMNGYGKYDNNNTNTVEVTVVYDNTSPSTAGRVLNMTYYGNGTPSLSPNPGYGGFYIAVNKCTTYANTDCYIVGNRYVYRMWAKIPSGRTINFATNSYGAEGTYTWVSSQTGTGTWEEYIIVQRIGETGTLSSTGYWYISGGTNTAFEWYVASLEMIGIDEPASVDLTKTLNVGYKQNVTLGSGSLLTTAATYLATDSGNVGIGMTSPGTKLHVNGTANVSGATYLYNSRCSSGQYLTADATTGLLSCGAPAGTTYTNGTGILLNGNQFNLSTAYTDARYLGISATAANSNQLNTQPSTYYLNQTGITAANITSGTLADARIANASTWHAKAAAANCPAGQVVMNTTSTGVQCVAVASGTVGGTGNSGNISYWTAASTLASSQIYQNGTNIGIGMIAPVEKLQVQGNIQATGGFPYIMLNSTTWSDVSYIQNNLNVNAGANGNYTAFVVPNNKGWIFTQTAGGTKLVIDTNGNVGIGTTGPIQKLDVVGSINASGAGAKVYTPELCLAGNCQTTWPSGGGGNITGSGTANYMVKWQNSTNLANSIIQDDGSTVGIGTAPATQKLTVSGNANITGTLYASNVSSNSPLQLQTAGTTRMYIADAGNVGINTTNPVAKLEIHDDVGTLTNENDYAIKINDGTSDTGLVIGVSAANDAAIIQSLDISNSWSTRHLSLMPNGGNLGIGDLSPTNKLDVAGAIGISDTTIIDASRNIVNAGTGAFSGALSSTTLNTGQGAYELYAMDQNVLTTSAPTFATVNTGQGAYELYAMNQNVQTTDGPAFANLSLTGRTKTTSGGAVTYENVAQYYNGNAISTGTIVITIDNAPNIMLDADITVQGYGGAHTYQVRGYTYTSTTNWHQPAASCAGSGAGSCSVRFANVSASSGKRVILLGTTATAWGAYPHVVVTRVTKGYPDTTDNIGTWSISMTTDESTYGGITAVNINDGFTAYNPSFTGTTNVAGITEGGSNTLTNDISGNAATATTATTATNSAACSSDGTCEVQNYIEGSFGNIARSTDEWLRLNQNSGGTATHTNGIYTPGGLRADGGLAAGAYSLVVGETRAALFRDGDSGYYVDPAGTTTAANLDGDIVFGSGDQVDFYDEVGDKAYWYSTSYGTGIEGSTLTDWSASQFRWRIGGTSVSSGTQYMLLDTSGLTVAGQLKGTNSFSVYTADGLFNANSRPSTITTPSGTDRIRFGYLDEGGGQYWGRIGFKGTTDWSLGTAPGGNSFSIGTGYNGGSLVIANTGNVQIGTSTADANARVKIDSNLGSANQAAMSVIYGGGTGVLGEFATLAHRNSVWSTIYASTGSSSTYAAYFSGNTVTTGSHTVGAGSHTIGDTSNDLLIDAGTGGDVIIRIG